MDSHKKKIDISIDELFGSKKIKKVLLINPPDVDKNLFNLKSANRGRNMNYPPYGLGLISSHLELLGIDNEFLNLNHIILNHAEKIQDLDDFNFEKIFNKNLNDKIKFYKPDIILIIVCFQKLIKLW